MSNDLPATGTYHLRGELSWRERFLENRAAFAVYCLIFLVCAAFGVLAGMFAPVLFYTFGFGSLSLIFFLLGGMAVGAATVTAISFAGRLKNRGRLKLIAIEERVASGKSEDIWQDLHDLIDGNLKLKRLQVADFYSRRLFELSQGQTGLSDVMLSTECWTNTKAYQKSAKYWLFWLFQSRGTLCLSGKALQYTSKKISFDLPLSDVTKISLATHPRWLKPIPLNYIVVDCLLDGEPGQIYLTPSLTQADNVWQVNAMIKTWFAYIARAKSDQINKVTGGEASQLTDDSVPHQLSA
jgi:hypothetical protein